MRGNLLQRLFCFHRDEKLVVETSGNRMFTRCTVCGHRTRGIETGELAITQLLPGVAYEARVDAFFTAVKASAMPTRRVA